MPSFDRDKRLKVGDRVRTKDQHQEGRVVNLVALAGDVLLATVAIFVGNAIIRKIQFPMRVGQVAGLPVEKIEQHTIQAAERGVANVVGDLIIDPRAGGIVSSAARSKALKNETIHRGESLSVRALKWAEYNQEHLSGIPGLAGPSRALGEARNRYLQAEAERSIARRSYIDKGPIEGPSARKVFQDAEERLEKRLSRHLKVREKIWERYGKSLETAYSDWIGGPLAGGQRLTPREFRNPTAQFDIELAQYISNPKHTPLLSGRETRMPRGAGPVDMNALEELTNKEFRRVQRFQIRREQAITRKRGYDGLLDYLTRKSSQTPEGKWTGGWLNDVVMSRGDVPLADSVVEKSNRAAKLLSGARFEFTPIERKEFERLYAPILDGYEGEVKSALDVFRIAANKVSTTPNWAERAGLWNERYAPLLRQLVERYHPAYKRDIEKIQLTGRFGRAFEESRNRLQLTTSELGFEKFSQTLQNIDFQNPARFEWELSRFINNSQDWLRGHGGEPVGLDLADLRRVPRVPGQRLLPGANWKGNDFGLFSQLFSTRQRAGGRFVGRGNRPLAGKIVDFGGVPHLVDYVSQPGRFETQGLTLRPLGQELNLITSTQPFDPETVLNLVHNIGTESPAARLVREAAEAAKRGTIPKTSIALRGGLLGTNEAIQEVPTELLYSYLTGSRLSKVQATQFSSDLQRLGFTGLAQFEAAQTLSRNRVGQLFGRVPRGEIRAMFPGYSEERLAQEVQDLTSQFRTTLFTSLGELPHGLHIDQLRERARTTSWHKVISAAKRGESAVVGLEDYVRWTGAGEAVLTEAAQSLDPIARANLLSAASKPALLFEDFAAKVRSFQDFSRLIEAQLEPDIRLEGESLANYNLRIQEKMGPQILTKTGGTVSQFRARLAKGDVGVRRAGETLKDYNIRIAEEEAALYESALVESFGHTFGVPNRVVAGETIGGTVKAGMPTIEEAVGILRGFDPNTQDLPNLAGKLSIGVVGVDATTQNKLDRLAKLATGGRSVVGRQKALIQAENIRQGVLENFRMGRVRLGLQSGVGTRTFTSFENPASREFYNTIIEMLESGRITEEQLGGLGLPFNVVPLPGKRFGIAGFDPNNPADRFIYRPFKGNIPGAGFAYSETNPNIVSRFGITEPTTLYGQELADAMSRGWLKPVNKATQRSLEFGMLAPTPGDLLPNLPVFHTPTSTLGFASNITTFEQVAANVQKLIQEPQNFISLDIERSRETGRILNIYAGLYDPQGNLVEHGVDLAVPEFWQKTDFATSNVERLEAARTARVSRIRAKVEAGQELSPQLRTIHRLGQRTEIGRVVASEQQMVREAVGWLQLNKGAVVGHNISFDFRSLIEAAENNGMAAEAEILRGIAGTQLVDTLLGAQISNPNAGFLNLEDIAINYLGKVEGAGGKIFREAHVARPDAALAAELWGEMSRRHGDTIVQALQSAQQSAITPGTLLWDPTKRRGFEFAGAINPNRAAELFHQQTGQTLDIGGGAALRPINFLTGEAGDAELFYRQTPHGFAKEFTTRFQVKTRDEINTLINGAEIADYARRPIRRIVGTDSGAFRQLLLERERFGLAQAKATGDDTFRASLEDLVRRQAGTQSETEAKLLGNAYNWAQNQLVNDSRLARERLFQSDFWTKEIAQHESVINKLWEYVRGETGGEALDQANRVWSAYMREVEKIAPWQKLADATIAPENRRLSFTIDLLGKNARAVRLTDPETIARDVDTLTVSILKKLSKEELQQAVPGVSLSAIQTLLQNQNKILDTSLGATARTHVWEKYIQPAMARGSTVAAEGMPLGQFQLQATGFNEAVAELQTRGQEFAQSAARNVQDVLTPRNIEQSALQNIQQSFLNTPVHELAAQLDRPSAVGDVILRGRHMVSPALQGRSMTELLQAASVQGEAEAAHIFRGRQQATLETLKRAARKFSGEELAVAQSAIGKVNPDWVGRILPFTNAAPTVAPAAPVEFTPGNVASTITNQIEQQTRVAAGWAEANPELLTSFKKTAAVGAVVLAGVVGYGLLRRPQRQPTRTHENTDRDTETTTIEQANRVRISIDAVDPGGINHDNLVASIHEAVGSHIGMDARHAHTVSDQRTKIDRKTVNDIAGRLMTAR